jgi:hypothetical protein
VLNHLLLNSIGKLEMLSFLLDLFYFTKLDIIVFNFIKIMLNKLIIKQANIFTKFQILFLLNIEQFYSEISFF